MADERNRIRSEQQESLDIPPIPSRRRAEETTGPQFSSPGDGGDFTDDESTAIADEAGTTYPLSPEEQAMHIEDEEGHAR
jgi:hypothetical protein